MKNLHRHLLMIALSLMVPAMLHAQADVDLVAEGDAAYNIGGKLLALETYELALKSNPNNVRANFMAGKCILETIDKGRASQYLLKAYELDPKVSNDIVYMIAESYHLGFKFDEAIDYYQKYRQTLLGDPSKKTLTSTKNELAKIEKRVRECENAKKFTADPNRYQSSNVGDGINTVYPEYGVAVNKDETIMVFTSRREGATGVGNVDKDLQYFEDIYISRFKDGKWEPATNMGGNINTEYHDASIGLSADGRTLFLYKDENGGDIYVSEMRDDSTWAEPKPIGDEINSPHHENSVSIAPDGKTLFFTSDRPGGQGGIDIYVSKLDKKGRWGKAANLGGPINTPENEDGPFMDYDNKTLYFSSNAHEGMGGYDVFVSELDSVAQTWKEPVNIGYPINTPDDDIYFVKSGNSKYGYYASVKDDGMGEKDIYKVLLPEESRTYEQLKNKPVPVPKDTVVAALEIPEAKKTPVAKLQPVTLRLRVLNESGKAVSANTIVVKGKEDGMLAGIKKLANGVYQCTFENASPQDYVVSVEQIGYMFENVDFTIPEMQATPQTVKKDVRLQKLHVGFATVLKNIYFDSDKATFKMNSYRELSNLARLMKQNASYRIEIAGHTDNVGSDKYNLKLSHRRSMAVVNYLISRGVDASRVVAQGYGESKPMASNDDEKEGRELNRRSEFIILSDSNAPASNSASTMPGE